MFAYVKMCGKTRRNSNSKMSYNTKLKLTILVNILFCT